MIFATCHDWTPLKAYFRRHIDPHREHCPSPLRTGTTSLVPVSLFPFGFMISSCNCRQGVSNPGIPSGIRSIPNGSAYPEMFAVPSRHNVPFPIKRNPTDNWSAPSDPNDPQDRTGFRTKMTELPHSPNDLLHNSRHLDIEQACYSFS
jgi:hypothetical protein